MAGWVVRGLVFFSGLATASGALAQGVSQGVLTGTVRDRSGGVVARASVTISSDALIGGTRTLATGDDGTYRAPALTPGTYVAEARANGFASVRRGDLLVAAGANLVVDFTLDVAGLTDQVVIEGATTGVDVRSPAAPFRIDQSFLFTLPTSRDVTRLINLVPGVSADVAYGGSQRSNALAVDGTNMTDPMFQDPQMRLNQNWVEQVHVAALGAPAEYGGATGVVANNVLRAGGNRTSGLGEVWTIQPGWLANNTSALEERLQTSFASRQIDSWWEGSGQVGGAILRDRLWYFTGLQALRHDDRPAGHTGEGSRDERDWQWLGKLTTAITPSLRAEGFLQLGARDVTGEYIGRLTPLEASNDVSNDQTVWNARAYWTIGDRTLLEVRHSGFDMFSAESPRAPRTRASPSPLYDLSTGMTTRTALNYFDQDSSRHETTATLSRYVSARGGAHDLKAGVEFDRTAATQWFGYPGGRVEYVLDGAPYGLELWPGDRGTATTQRFSAFVQDAWQMHARLTLSAGVRVDANRGDAPGAEDVFATTPISPRIGLAWDVRRDHRTVARVHWGRYHDTIFSSRIMQADVTGISPYSFSLWNGTEYVISSQQLTPQPFRIDPEMRHSGVDQWVVGVDHELPWNIVLTAQGISRRFSAFMGLIDEGSSYTPVQRIDPGPDGALNTADDGGPLTVFALTNPGNRALVYTNPDQAYNRYDAVQFIGRRRFIGWWQMQASYTWSRNEGTVGNRWHVNAARFDLGSPGRFVNPNSFINAYGRATHDPTHEGKILGLVRLPWLGGANLSGVYRYTTGQAWARRVRFTGLPQGQEPVRVEPVGARRAPAINRLDLRAEKTFPLGGERRTLGIFLEAFNVGNQGVPNSDVPQAYQFVSGPTFGQPVAWVSPRLLRAAVRYSF